jgi:hypothetical protein
MFVSNGCYDRNVSNVPSKPRIQVRKSRCVRSGNGVGLGNRSGGGGSITYNKSISSQKLQKIIVYFFSFIFVNSDRLCTKSIKVRRRLRLVQWSATAAARRRARATQREYCEYSRRSF